MELLVRVTCNPHPSPAQQRAWDQLWAYLLRPPENENGGQWCQLQPTIATTNGRREVERADATNHPGT